MLIAGFADRIIFWGAAHSSSDVYYRCLRQRFAESVDDRLRSIAAAAAASKSANVGLRSCWVDEKVRRKSVGCYMKRLDDLLTTTAVDFLANWY